MQVHILSKHPDITKPTHYKTTTVPGKTNTVQDILK